MCRPSAPGAFWHTSLELLHRQVQLLDQVVLGRTTHRRRSPRALRSNRARRAIRPIPRTAARRFRGRLAHGNATTSGASGPLPTKSSVQRSPTPMGRGSMRSSIGWQGSAFSESRLKQPRYGECWRCAIWLMHSERVGPRRSPSIGRQRQRCTVRVRAFLPSPIRDMQGAPRLEPSLDCLRHPLGLAGGATEPPARSRFRLELLAGAIDRVETRLSRDSEFACAASELAARLSEVGSDNVPPPLSDEATLPATRPPQIEWR